MKVLVACEFSGVVRRAFRALGHDAWSCDLLPSEDNSPFHVRVDDAPPHSPTMTVWDVLKPAAEGGGGPWDLVIAHPPCTFLANSGVKWMYLPRTDGNPGRSHDRDPVRWTNMRKGARFFADLWNACGDTPRCFENPVMHGYAQMEIVTHAHVPFGKHPDIQFIDPRGFGHMETKRTGLYRYKLPALVETNPVYNEASKLTVAERSRVHYCSPGPDRWKERSRTVTGIAAAMAAQWGG